MNDPANTLLIDVLNNDQREPLLWIVDENLPSAELNQLLVSPRLLSMTNRVDVAQRLRDKGLQVELCDFDFRVFDDRQFAAVYYRVSKEKALVHHVINSAGVRLAVGGQLILAGSKQEGIKTYCAKTSAYLGGQLEKIKGAATAQLCQIEKTVSMGTTLEDKAYTETVEVVDKEVVFYSKPGLYGWNKIDQGSQLLIAQLPGVLDRLSNKPEKIIDLGCGYGYLSVMTSQLVDAEFFATDNNIAAVEYCRKNFSRHGVCGEVILADSGSGLQAGIADLVICNPPFHQGFAVEGDLTDRFLRAARDVLTGRGRAVFVVNSFIPIEKKARAYFKQVECLDNNKRFKVMLLIP